MHASQGRTGCRVHNAEGFKWKSSDDVNAWAQKAGTSADTPAPHLQ